MAVGKEFLIRLLKIMDAKNENIFNNYADIIIKWISNVGMQWANKFKERNLIYWF